jgi:hypothetical protein
VHTTIYFDTHKEYLLKRALLINKFIAKPFE